MPELSTSPKRRTAAALVLASLWAAASHRFSPVAAQPAAAPRLALGVDADKELGAARSGVLKRLERDSRSPVRVTLDRASGAVLHLELDRPVRAGVGEEQSALAFVKEFQGLLDPRIGPDEYRVAPAQSCGGAAVLERVVDGVPVAGSTLVIRFGPRGSIRSVHNSVASVPRQVDHNSGAGAGLPSVRSSLPSGASLATLRGEPVLLPVRDGGRLYLRPARRLKLTAAREERFAYALTDRLGRAVDVVRAEPQAPGTEQPLHHMADTGIPDFITYRPVGGVKVEKLASEANAGETVYRFLEQHPALFRTGAPRCQFEVANIRETPALPGVQFVRMRQLYAGLPVFGAELSFEVHDLDTVFSVAGHSLPRIFVPVEARLSAAAAIATAKQLQHEVLGTRQLPSLELGAVRAELDAHAAEAELGVFPGPLAPREKLEARLAWRVDLRRTVYFIDALDGRKLYAYSPVAKQTFIVNDAAGASELGRPLYQTVNVNGVAVATAVAANTDAVPVAASMPHLRNTLASAGWFGVDGAGATPFVANTFVTMLSGCANAENLQESFFCLGLARPDVVGHEFIHGVVLHSSRLIYADESGALNESYADVLGNLIFPDGATPPFRPGINPAGGLFWQQGEVVPGFPGGPAVAGRNLANPALSAPPQPVTMAGYLSRNAAAPPAGPGACTDDPTSCDSGFVHFNSGITNRAHALLAPGANGGITRPRLFTLAFTVLTQRLTPWSRMLDSAMATHEVCESLRIRGGPAFDGASFGFAECDQVPVAFRTVGLSADLSSGWAEPILGFVGTDTNFTRGETVASGCPLINVFARLTTPAGVLQSDLAAGLAAGLGSGTSASYKGLFGVAVLGTPNPIGTTAKRHDVACFNVFGRRPQYASDFDDGGGNCNPGPPGMLVERTSAAVKHTGSWNGSFGSDGNENAGPTASQMNAACVLVRTSVELVDSEAADARVIATEDGSGNAKREIDRVFGVTRSKGARLTSAPPGLGADGRWNLSAGVRWWVDTGDLFYRLRYYIQQPNGVLCNP